mmetsp:Transcript_33093/g.77438  ORF Transcript_33093/g.77438 Transcript_33093/m.77438 type:complete len:230 (+) Transcript_33093:99-788(+)
MTMAFDPLRSGKMETQSDWHETFRDHASNMYRTSYSDMVHGNEVHVRADFPAGYGGHDPPYRHDILFRNTGFDRVYRTLRNHPQRDTFPSFEEQKMGLPSVTRFPRGARRPPSATGTKPMSYVTPPWGVTHPVGQALTFRAKPPTTPRLAQSLTPRSTRPATSIARMTSDRPDATYNPLATAAESMTSPGAPGMPLSARESRLVGKDLGGKLSPQAEAVAARRSIRFSD